MAKVSVYNIEGKEVDTIELNDAVFGVEVNEHLVHTMETERNRSRKTGINKITSVDRRWSCICSGSERLLLQNE